MQKLQILNSKEKKKILNFLKEQFGYEDNLDFVFLKNNKQRIYLMSKDMIDIDVDSLRIDSLGSYFATIYDNEIRPSIEGSQIIGPKAKKGIIVLNDGQIEDYLKGMDLVPDEDQKMQPGYCIVKYKQDYLGCVKVSDRILNFISKARRLKNLNI